MAEWRHSLLASALGSYRWSASRLDCSTPGVYCLEGLLVLEVSVGALENREIRSCCKSKENSSFIQPLA